jgi:hypothetical protein
VGGDSITADHRPAASRASEITTVPETGAITIEPRPAVTGLPTPYFHLVVALIRVAKGVISEVEPLFELAGMN